MGRPFEKQAQAAPNRCRNLMRPSQPWRIVRKAGEIETMRLIMKDGVIYKNTLD